MIKRDIVQIDEDKCVGCGLCIPKCQEGALKIIDGKARLSSEAMCDGLGKCLGSCPMDAITIVEREAPSFEEQQEKHEGHAAGPKGHEGDQHHGHNHGHHHGHQPGTHQGHGHKEAHSAKKSTGCGCPGTAMQSFEEEAVEENIQGVSSDDMEVRIKPQLKQWPVQLSLVPVAAPYFKNSDILVTADCVPYAYPNYHLELLKGKSVVIGCPKLDNNQSYVAKLTEIFKENDLNSITVAHMEVPCCNGIVWAVEEALAKSGKNIPLNKVEISVRGQRKN